jgi:hypothetical protein
MLKINKQPSDLDKNELEELVTRIRDILMWSEQRGATVSDDEFWSEENQWSSDQASQIACVLEAYELVPLSYVEGETSEAAPDRLFITSEGDETVCPDCLTPADKERVGDSNVEVWEEGSAGWVSAPTCDRCGKTIDVVIGDGVDG